MKLMPTRTQSVAFRINPIDPPANAGIKVYV